MLRNKKVKLVKIAATKDAKIISASWEEYVPGEVNTSRSLPVEYTLTGQLITEPVVGLSLLVNRDSRNNVPVQGIFQSSKIKKITKESEIKIKLETENSIYYLEVINV